MAETATGRKERLQNNYYKDVARLVHGEGGMPSRASEIEIVETGFGTVVRKRFATFEDYLNG